MTNREVLPVVVTSGGGSMRSMTNREVLPVVVTSGGGTMRSRYD